ncbi:kinetochore-associated protein NSL1 homolog [Cheilinus undulatus]|uniref:kinetochore-associated protein NSL1 homolog n=1 Tax=Cheilinus undulatus TaxID=241271 RepID=UPI001BD34004|nr:kinetochore-associated protein NSL1 homolog [Cheilinus undulatus]
METVEKKATPNSDENTEKYEEIMEEDGENSEKEIQTRGEEKKTQEEDKDKENGGNYRKISKLDDEEDSRKTPSEGEEDYRVRVQSKTTVTDQINKYKEILKKALEGQKNLEEETKREIITELLMNFEAAVQENVLVNGKPWEEAPDDEESEAMDMESLLDDTIVETTRRRRTYPRKILHHVLHSQRAERKLMGLYEQTVKPQEVVKDPERENIMTDLSSSAPVMVKEAIQVIKSINTLQKQAEGLCEILNMQPSHTTMEIHREVFGQSDATQLPLNGAMRSRQPIKRTVEEAVEANCYVPLTEKLAPEDTME